MSHALTRAERPSQWHRQTTRPDEYQIAELAVPLIVIGAVVGAALIFWWVCGFASEITRMALAGV